MLEIFTIAKRKFRSALVRARRVFVSQRFGFSPDVIYGQEFYDGGGFSLTRDTANRISKYLGDSYGPKDILDIGCGPGEYLRAFSELNIAAFGCDGASNGVLRANSKAFSFVHDLKKPLTTNRKFGLVLCVEVAEHLPHSASGTLVKSICDNASDVIAFTAAPPGCPGDDHINCQAIDYWAERFLTHGFHLDLEATKRLREFAEANECAKWWQGWSYVFVTAKSKS